LDAFINSLINEKAYIQYPPGVPKSTKVVLFLRALYGLRHSPMLWQQELGKVLTELGPKKCFEEPCLYFGEHILVFFVDEIVIPYKREYKTEMEKIQRQHIQTIPNETFR
jgi:hypothetical protein